MRAGDGKQLYYKSWPYELTEIYNFGAETHLGAGVTSAFVYPLAVIA